VSSKTRSISEKAYLQSFTAYYLSCSTFKTSDILNDSGFSIQNNDIQNFTRLARNTVENVICVFGVQNTFNM